MELSKECCSVKLSKEMYKFDHGLEVGCVYSIKYTEKTQDKEVVNTIQDALYIGPMIKEVMEKLSIETNDEIKYMHCFAEVNENGNISIIRYIEPNELLECSIAE